MKCWHPRAIQTGSALLGATGENAAAQGALPSDTITHHNAVATESVPSLVASARHAGATIGARVLIPVAPATGSSPKRLRGEETPPSNTMAASSNLVPPIPSPQIENLLTQPGLEGSQ